MPEDIANIIKQIQRRFMHAAMAEIHTAKKTQTDRQTDGYSLLCVLCLPIDSLYHVFLAV